MESDYYISPNHPLMPDDYELFQQSLSQDEKVLLQYAEEALGSSFILRYTHIYKNWKSKKLK